MIFSAKSFAPLALALASAVVAPHALAAKQVDASITLNSYQLIDLDQHDGVNPELSVNYNYVYGGSNFSNTHGNGSSWDSHVDAGPLTFSDHTHGMANQASASGNFLTDIQIHGNTQIAGQFGATMISESLFQLSPHTEFVLLGHTNGSIVSNNGGYATGENGGASAWISVTYDYVNGPSTMQFASIYGAGNSQTSQFEQNFELHFRNDSDVAIAGHLKSALWAGATDSGAAVTPVPEPETYALMGMGLLGLMAARRRKK